MRRILALALPIIGGMTSQNLFNLVDTAMVGTLGNQALAAVGLASFANFMSAAFITGMSAGVQAMSARWLGEGRHEETAVPLNGGLLLAIGIGVPLSVVLIAITPLAFPWIASDAGVAADGSDYLQIRLIALAGMGANFAFRGYWNAINMSRLYMGTLVLMHVANVFLNWVLIFGNLGAPELGVTGAAIASASSVYIGTACYIVMALRHARAAGFLAGLPGAGIMRSMVNISFPAGMQTFFFAAGMTVLFWIVGQIGTAELAASHVLITVMLVTILPAIGFGLAAASLVGQALGAKDRTEAKAVGWAVVRVASAVVGVVALFEILFPDIILGVFLHDPDTLALARWPLRVVGLATIADTMGMVLLNAHLGAGYSKWVMKVSIALQWGVFLPAAYLVGPVLGYGLLAVWIANAAFRALQAGIMANSWRKGRWAFVAV